MMSVVWLIKAFQALNKQLFLKITDSKRNTKSGTKCFIAFKLLAAEILS